MTAFRHEAVLAEPPVRLDGDARPEPGPIAVLPVREKPAPEVADVEAAGGTVAPLDDSTRGIVYTSYRDVDSLIDALERYPRIGWVQLPFAGIDAYAKRLAPFAERGIVFTSGKGAFAQPVAEHALMLALALQRQLPVRLRCTEWHRGGGRSLFGANVAIVGAGGIALELLRLLEPFGCTTTIVRRRADAVPGADRTVATAQLDEVLPEADVVILAAASTDETRHLIDARRLALMQPTAVLVNIGRGPLVDTDALVAALDAEEVWGAGLDVTDPEPLPAGHPLWTSERCIITPHTADTPEMTRPLMATRIRANVDGFLRTGEFIGVADPRAGY